MARRSGADEARPPPARSVALLRGINVGGNHPLAMVDLVAAFVGAGCVHVSTYIQSGNVVFGPPVGVSGNLVSHLQAAIEAVAGFPVPVVVRTGSQLRTVVDANPFPAVEATKLHVAFLGGTAAPSDLDAFSRAAQGDESFVLVDRDLYLHLPDGMGRAKLPQGLGRLKVTVTVRNWRTVTKLVDLAGE